MKIATLILLTLTMIMVPTVSLTSGASSTGRTC